MNVQKQHNMQAQVTYLLLFSWLKRMGIEDKKTSKGLFGNSLFSWNWKLFAECTC